MLSRAASGKICGINSAISPVPDPLPTSVIEARIEQHKAEKKAECLREIGVLVVVFYGPLEHLYRPPDAGRGWGWYAVCLGVVLGLALMSIATYLETRNIREKYVVEQLELRLHRLRREA